MVRRERVETTGGVFQVREGRARAAGWGGAAQAALRGAFRQAVSHVKGGVRSATTSRSPSVKATTNMGGNAVNRPRAADDFAMIRARMEELRRECERGEAGQTEVQSDPPMRPRRSIYWPDEGVSVGPNQDRRSGPIRGREELS